jgi:hypothetical protein
MDCCMISVSVASSPQERRFPNWSSGRAKSSSSRKRSSLHSEPPRLGLQAPLKTLDLEN